MCLFCSFKRFSFITLVPPLDGGLIEITVLDTVLEETNLAFSIRPNVIDAMFPALQRRWDKCANLEIY